MKTLQVDFKGLSMSQLNYLSQRMNGKLFGIILEIYKEKILLRGQSKEIDLIHDELIAEKIPHKLGNNNFNANGNIANFDFAINKN